MAAVPSSTCSDQRRTSIIENKPEHDDPITVRRSPMWTGSLRRWISFSSPSSRLSGLDEIRCAWAIASARPR